MCVASEAMRGSTPLDVAASSVMDNNGLALALEEPDLEKVCYLKKNTHTHFTPLLMFKQLFEMLRGKILILRPG